MNSSVKSKTSSIILNTIYSIVLSILNIVNKTLLYMEETMLRPLLTNIPSPKQIEVVCKDYVFTYINI